LEGIGVDMTSLQCVEETGYLGPYFFKLKNSLKAQSYCYGAGVRLCVSSNRSASSTGSQDPYREVKVCFVWQTQKF